MRMEIARHGEKREVEATEGELAFFEVIKSILIRAGAKPESVRLIRKSDSYLTVICRGEIVRFKYTERARWISIQIVDSVRSNYESDSLFDSQKNKGQLFWKSSISDISDIESEPAYSDLITAAYKEGF